MKRLHVHVSVDDLATSSRFYSTLFAAEPTVTKPDYVKWMLDDPRVNFEISTRSGKSGLDHSGIQVETKDELHESTVCGDSADLGPIRVADPAACCTTETPQGACCAPKPELAAPAACCGPASGSA
jgi:hypothetical protein